MSTEYAPCPQCGIPADGLTVHHAHDCPFYGQPSPLVVFRPTMPPPVIADLPVFDGRFEPHHLHYEVTDRDGRCVAVRIRAV